MKIKLLSWNIHKGFDMAGRRFTLSAIRTAIRDMSPDVVCLQEVQGEHSRLRSRYHDWPTESQFEFLADTVWPHYAYGKNAIYPTGHHGNAILSKYPIVAWDNVDLTLHSWEMRGLLHANIQIPGTDRHFHIMNTHINLFHHMRMRQVERIIRHVQHKLTPQDPFVIAGDFNDWSTELSVPLYKTLGVHEAFLENHGRYARTFPCFWPTLPLDRVYLHKVHATHAQVLHGKPWSNLSDHLPVYVEMEIY